MLIELFTLSVEVPLWFLVYLFFHVLFIGTAIRWFVEAMPSKHVQTVDDLTVYEAFVLGVLGPPLMLLWNVLMLLRCAIAR
jgi:hypothetical protein